MPYYIRHTAHCQRLVEISHTDAADPISGVDYTRCSPEYARTWVKNGHPHETPLWVDYDGKVKYARDGT